MVYNRSVCEITIWIERTVLIHKILSSCMLLSIENRLLIDKNVNREIYFLQTDFYEFVAVVCKMGLLYCYEESIVYGFTFEIL